MFRKLTPNLMVPSVSKAITFYKDILGFEVVMTMPEEGEPGFAILHAGPVELMLQSQSSMKEDISAFAAQPIGSSAICYCDVEDVDALFKRVDGHAEIVHPLRDTFYGMREFYMRDPNGYTWGFAQRTGGE